MGPYRFHPLPIIRNFHVFFFIILLYSPLLCASAQAEPWYKIGPGDVLEISVWKDQELTRQVIVQPDGYISFPLIGQIQAGDCTLSQIQEEIAKKLEEYLPNPTVTVMPVKIESYKIYVIGKVNKPGMFALPEKINVMQALSIAGGTTPYAKLGDIIILRQGPNGQMRIPFNYKKVAKGKDLKENIQLKRGDVVVVP